MNDFKPAKTIETISPCIALGALQHDDERYVSIEKTSNSLLLNQLELQLRDTANVVDDFKKIILAGHRGCGKSMELKRLHHVLGDTFTTLYFPISKHVLRDCDHIDVMVWLVEHLLRKFSLEKWPLTGNIVIDITDWFSKKAFDDPERIKEEIRSETGTDMQSLYGFFWMPIQLLNRIKSMMIASAVHRKTIRKKLHSYTVDMLHQVNRLLDDARVSLKRIDRVPHIVIAIDNIDHMPTDIAAKLFYDGADIFNSLRANIIFPVPISLKLPPPHIENNFEHCYTLAPVPIGTKRSKKDDALLQLQEFINKRIDANLIFTSQSIVDDLARISGGFYRDFLVLIHNAQLAARSLKLKKIDKKCAEIAIKRLGAYFEKMLIPHEVYYPLLKAVHHSGSEQFLIDNDRSIDGIKNSRFFGAELLSIGAVIDYNKDDFSYSIHPALLHIESFKNFLKENPV